MTVFTVFKLHLKKKEEGAAISQGDLSAFLSNDATDI